jgi:hypothetical protein
VVDERLSLVVVESGEVEDVLSAAGVPLGDLSHTDSLRASLDEQVLEALAV